MPSVQLNSTCFLLEKKEKKSRWPTTLSDAVEAELREYPSGKSALDFFQGTTYKTSTLANGPPPYTIRYTALQQKLKPQLKLLFMENKQQMWQQQRSGLGKSLRWTLCSRTQTIILRSQQLSTGKK